MKALYNLLKINPLKTLFYHSQMDGLVECFNKMLKEVK